MRTDPFTDTWLFLAGRWDDETAIGPWRWLFVVLLVGLLFASIIIAAREWRADPSQRTARHLIRWAIRVLVGGMWFVNTLWKLPLFSEDSGLHYWVEQEEKGAAFAWHQAFVSHVLLQTPVFIALDFVTFFLELSFAVALILGLGVRAIGVIGVVFVAQLWLGLYLVDSEWPWTYVFLMMLMGLFALDGFGRSLGLDAWLRRRYAGQTSAASRLVAVAT